MTKFKDLLSGCVAVYIFTALTLAHAQEVPVPQEPSPNGHFGQRIQEIYSRLGLTDDQKQRLEINKQQHRASMEKARQEMKECREALQQELMQPQLDMPRIGMLHARIKALLVRMEDIRLNSVLTVRNILTPEQFTEFVNMMHRHRQDQAE